MKRFLTLFLVLLLSCPAQAATKIFFRDSASALGGTRTTGGASIGCGVGSNDWAWKLANTTQGGSTQTAQFSPSSGTPPCVMQTASGSGLYLRWITPPISSNVTVSGNIDFSFGGAEGHVQLNAGGRVVVYRWSAESGGLVSTVMTSADTAEFGTTAGLETITAAAPTSTDFVVGDRIAFIIEIQNVGGTWGGNGARTVDILYDGTSASTGDAFANFVDTISFSADSNNGPSRPATSSLDFFEILKETFFGKLCVSLFA